MINKKLLLLAASAGLVGSVMITGGAAHAQLFTYTGTSTAPSSSVVMATTTASSAASSSVPVVISSYASGYLQIDGLTVTGMTSPMVPSQILLTNTSYPSVAAGGGIAATSTQPITCEQFATDSSPVGIAVTCPAPPLAPPVPTTTSTPSGVYYSPYAVNVGPTTQLLFSDRTPATLADIATGDVVNVYGYYNSGDGSIDGEIVRDLSKPVAPVTTIPANNAGSTTTTTANASSTLVAQLQADVNELALLVEQLQAAVSSSVTSSVSTSASAPMIPAPGY